MKAREIEVEDFWEGGRGRQEVEEVEEDEEVEEGEGVALNHGMMERAKWAAAMRPRVRYQWRPRVPAPAKFWQCAKSA